ncbi:hypothetical protein [Streptomyces sp900105755]|uniref:Uncharacterized protein n=1 Tax=Streptomyces sp. 900105755 TaxID=3154389 RepID=A0ABV1TUV8_9ACTN
MGRDTPDGDLDPLPSGEAVGEALAPHAHGGGESGGSSDEAISPDGQDIWLGMPTNGRTTAVLNAATYRVEAVLHTGPRTNHPNFLTVGGVDYAYQTVGGLNETLVYRRSRNGAPPTLMKTIHNNGHGPHGIWPSPDNTRIYVALQNSDAVDVIDTHELGDQDSSHRPVAHGAGVRGAQHSGHQHTQPGSARAGHAHADPRLARLGQLRPGHGPDPGTPRHQRSHHRGHPVATQPAVHRHASDGTRTTALMSMMSNRFGNIDEALSYSYFFANHYTSVVLKPGAPSGEQESGMAMPQA